MLQKIMLHQENIGPNLEATIYVFVEDGRAETFITDFGVYGGKVLESIAADRLHQAVGHCRYAVEFGGAHDPRDGSLWRYY